MKKIAPLFFIVALIACNTSTTTNTDTKKDNNSYVWSDDIQTILPLEKDTAFNCSDLTNATTKFDEEKVFSSITKAILSGKIKAYSDFPNKELSIDQVNKILVHWDSTTTVEDPNKPGTFISAPTKFEIVAWNVPKIKFHEKIELDTLTGILNKKVSYVTLYNYKQTETGEIVGIKKMFDVKFNEEK